MIRRTILAVIAFAPIAGALTSTATAAEQINPARSPALAGSLQTAAANPLEGKRLRYLIGADYPGAGNKDEVIEVAYDVVRPPAKGLAIAYCNLFDEENTGKYGPYLHTSDTAAQYDEGQIDPRGPGWEKNLRQQFERRKRQGFVYIELDNSDAYSLADVIGAIDLAATYGLKVIAKNPGVMNGDATPYVAHHNVFAIIVEKDAGTPQEMDALRRKADKPTLPVWFVAFGDGRAWAKEMARTAADHQNMSVTYSSRGEYVNSIDVHAPAPALASSTSTPVITLGTALIPCPNYGNACLLARGDIHEHILRPQ